MLTTAVNVFAFYLGALFIGRSHSLVGVLVFVLTALVVTIISTLLEVYLQSLLVPQRPARSQSRHPRSSRRLG